MPRSSPIRTRGGCRGGRRSGTGKRPRRATAYQAIFSRRLARGQSYGTLALGWSEFTPSYFGPFRGDTKVCEDLPDICIPSMLRGVFQDGFASPYHAVYDTGLCIRRGVLAYPRREDCL